MAQDDKPTLVQRPSGYGKLVPKGYKNVAKDKVYKKLEDITKTDVATFIAEMTPVIGDAIAAKEVYDEIQKDDPNWLLIGALGGATIIGAVPFVGDAAAELIKKGARQALDVAKRIEVDPNAIGSLGGNIRIKAAQEVVEDFVPQKTVKAYKLFTKGKDGKLYPLFVDAQKEVPTDKWLAATFPDYRFTAENGKQYVPSKGTDGKPGTGDSINIPDQETRDKLIEAGFLPKGSKAKAVKAVAARPGWHGGDVPIATHIGPETNIGGKQVKYRGDDQVWAEIEMPADVDWQQIANSKARIKKDGNIDVRTADINDEMPKAGHYRYKTNPNMTGEWLISGDMKVNRVLDRSEVNAINEAAGVKDLPTLSELNKGYSKGGNVMDDYQYAEMMSNGYAVGGAVEKQTRMAFADGGIPIDPVSGNEVPPGSLPEEVRDDIKVGVSAGEYIVPADVLRYYGMKFFEDLRAEAKAALGGMEQDGRMGGEPMEAPMEEEDDLPFSTEELQAIDDTQMNKGGYMRGYAEAGMVVNPYTVGSGIMPGVEGGDTQMASIFGSQGLGIQYVTYYGPNGETITIQTFNGSPMTPVPEGYTRTPPVAVAPTAPAGDTAAVAPVAAPQDNNDNDNSGDQQPEPRTFEDIQNDIADRFADIDFDDLGTSIDRRIKELTKEDPKGFFANTAIAKIGAGLNRVSEVGEINALIGIVEEQQGIDAANALRDSLAIQMKNQNIVVPAGMGTGTQYGKDLRNPYYGIVGEDGKRHKLTTAELAALGKQRKAEEKAALEAERIRQQKLAATPLPTPAQDAAAVKQYTQDRSDRSSEASEMLKSFDSNVAKVQAASKDKSAANKASTSKNAASVKSSLQSRSKGSTQGFAKGGLMTKKK
jgi:hypothetical protein